MIDESDNAALEDAPATDNVDTSNTDTPEEFDYYDPDEEEQDNVADEPTTETDDEEEGETETEAPEELAADDEDEPVYAEDTAMIKLADGTNRSVADLKSDGLRQDDYSRKTQELSNERKTVQADVARMQRITESFVDHITALVPDAPEASLALSNPGAYTAQKAQHEAAMGQVQKLIEMGEAPAEIGAAMNEADTKAQLQQANERLIELFPEAAGGEGREVFFNGVQSAANSLGFSNQELGQVSDPRIFAMAHWAKKGLAAQAATVKAKAKVAKAPPATPRKPGRGAGKQSGNVEAMRKLNSSGSIRDAMNVDFD